MVNWLPRIVSGTITTPADLIFVASTIAVPMVKDALNLVAVIIIKVPIRLVVHDRNIERQWIIHPFLVKCNVPALNNVVLGGAPKAITFGSYTVSNHYSLLRHG